jgi:tRNA-specific 2-thiouridylase
MKRVVVGLSGGVDSSVSAYLLKEQGYEVIGLFMRNWLDDTVTISDECPWLEDATDAMQVAEKLNIPFQILDLSAEYKARIVDYMFAEYAKGNTPNPDVLCNREIKFDVFLKAAENLGAELVATGHYCQKGEESIDGQRYYQLKAGADGNKDQSYFLCQINQDQLSKALFPIGHLQKSEVRRIAKEQELVTAEKRDSQGLCFVGKVKLPVFLQQQLAAKKGDIIEIPKTFDNRHASHTDESESLSSITAPYNFNRESGTKIGEHDGAHFFTVGQRKGLAVGGTPEPLFVIDTDTTDNLIYVGQGDAHPGLYRQGLKVLNEDVHWLREDKKLQNGEEADYDVRIRYRQALEKGKLHQREDGLYITFENAQRGVARGQFAAWYEGDELIGSGVIL